MRRALPDDYELDDDRGRVDVDVVYRYLAEGAYWVPGRDRATIEQLVRESTRVIGAYVFVSEGHRGKGLGVELVREAVEDPAHRDLAWFLNTKDAHSLYARFGFEKPNERTMVRLRRG